MKRIKKPTQIIKDKIDMLENEVNNISKGQTSFTTLTSWWLTTFTYLNKYSSEIKDYSKYLRRMYHIYDIMADYVILGGR